MGNSCCGKNQPIGQPSVSLISDAQKSIQINCTSDFSTIKSEAIDVHFHSKESSSRPFPMPIVIDNPPMIEDLNQSIDKEEIWELSERTDQLTPTKLKDLKRLSLATSPLSPIQEELHYKISPQMFINKRQGLYGQYYRVLQQIGRGSYGNVWKVVHKNTGLVRVVKQISKKDMHSEDNEVVNYEIMLLKTLDHPNIIKIFEWFEDEENYYLITEFLEGGQLLEKHIAYTENQTIEIMVQILYALAYCHEKHIVHRDIKAENILFSNKGSRHLKIIDFGTARSFQKNQALTRIIGTPYYLAPEVLKENYTELCDVWGCGILCFQLICGSFPFQGDQQTLFRNIIEGKPKFDKYWDQVSPAGQRFIQRLLSVDPKNRPTCREALNDPWLMNATWNQVSMHDMKFCTPKQNIVLKNMILVYMVGQILTNKDLEVLFKSYYVLDKNRNSRFTRKQFLGSLSTTELQLASRDCSKKYQNNTEAFIKAFDYDQSEQIEFTGTDQIFYKMNSLSIGFQGKDSSLKMCVCKLFEFLIRVGDTDQIESLLRESLDQFLIGYLEWHILQIWNQFMSYCQSRYDMKYGITKDLFVQIIREE